MHEEPKRLWLEELRSGEYPQGKGTLSDGNNYCCLGVACEVAIKNGIELQRVVCEDGIVQYDGHRSMLPYKVAEWMGCKTDPLVTIDDRTYSLSEMNDMGSSFEQIAKVIEEQL